MHQFSFAPAQKKNNYLLSLLCSQLLLPSLLCLRSLLQLVTLALQKEHIVLGARGNHQNQQKPERVPECNAGGVPPNNLHQPHEPNPPPPVLRYLAAVLTTCVPAL